MATAGRKSARLLPEELLTNIAAETRARALVGVLLGETWCCSACRAGGGRRPCSSHHHDPPAGPAFRPTGSGEQLDERERLMVDTADRAAPLSSMLRLLLSRCI